MLVGDVPTNANNDRKNSRFRDVSLLIKLKAPYVAWLNVKNEKFCLCAFGSPMLSSFINDSDSSNDLISDLIA